MSFIKVIIFIIVSFSVFRTDALGIQEKKLFENAQSGRLKYVRQARRKGVNVNARDERGWTALHYAAYFGHLNIVVELLDMNCDISIKTPAGKTAYDFAKERLHIAVMIELFAVSAVNELCPF